MRGVRYRLTRSASGAGSGAGQPTFWAQLADGGAGAVTTTLTRGLGSPTFARATTAWAKLSTGLWASVATGTARSHYLGADTTVGAYGGYLAEEARTNLCLQSRDLSNASWTKTTATAVKDQVGIDGVANSASSLTATAGGGSCVQTITQAATNAALSFFIKRITGTGTITLKQGATTLDVTASINSSTYTRVPLVASVLNPSIGIVLGTNGDKIAVDMGQFENGAFATTPIPTTTVSVARNADALTYPTSGNVLGTVGTAYMEVTSSQVAGVQTALIENPAGGGGYPMLISAANNLALYDSNAVNQLNALVRPISAVTKLATKWAGLSCTGYVAGVPSAPAAFDGDLNMAPSIELGGGSGGEYTNGTIKNVRIWTRALTDIQIAGL